MKKLKRILGLSLALVFLSAVAVNAQSNQEEVDFVQSIFGMEKKQAVAEFLDLDSSNAFWPLYDEYEVSRKELGKRRVDLLDDYVSNYETMDGVATDAMVKEAISLRKAHDKLIDQYYKKIKKVSGAKRAAQFYQIENYIQSAIRYGILEGIPFLEE
ncbi:hypothetical protein [Eudoraea chungangensis]|uniref:hypothetical protein n=1 Tax=Eudoraea chungangensis TaxID=1481905 RepID=UPI0023ED3DA7|nr:hypothetical protein [Eudoraea chungangensis]